jgi:hypothetical protein
MTYKILTQKVFYSNQITLNWYTEKDNNPWETDDIDIALAKYKELLQKYAAKNLTLLSTIPVDIEITT